MKYQINYKGKELKYRANDWQSFESEAWDIFVWVLDHPEQESEYQFVVDGKIVSLSDAQKYAKLARKQYEEKRSTTHKQITKRKQGTQGNFKNNFETVWVKIW